MKNIDIQHLCEIVESRTKQHRSFSFAPDYAERGYSSPAKGIVFGNWNPVCGFGRTKEEQKRDPVSKLARVLEHAGFELEWEDEWSTCCDCGKAVRTQPDCYSWTPYFRIANECELVCLDCLDPETYLAECEDDCRKAFPPEWNPEDFGYVKFNGDFETGFHAGQTDDPKKILALLHGQGKRGVVFRIKGKGQFDLTWEAYYKPAQD
jgi:hypothetical protein